MKKIYLIRLIIAGIVLIMAILAIAGFYPFKFLNIEFAPLLQRVSIDFSILAVGIFLILILTTLIFGRIYCSTLCPFGILQEFASLIFKRKNKPQKNLKFKYIIAAVTFGSLTGGSALLIRHIDPYTIFGSAVSLSIYGIISTVVVLAIVFFKTDFSAQISALLVQF